MTWPKDPHRLVYHRDFVIEQFKKAKKKCRGCGCRLRRNNIGDFCPRCRRKGLI